MYNTWCQLSRDSNDVIKYRGAQEYIDIYKKIVEVFCQSVPVCHSLGETFPVTTSPPPPTLKDDETLIRVLTIAH